MASARWIGLDVDGCIGNLSPIAIFAAKFDPKKLAELMYAPEMRGETMLIRPGFADVVSSIAKATREDKIIGAFLYSNNKREETIKFVQELLNIIAAESPFCVRPFIAAFHRSAASRCSQGDKNFHDICNMLHCEDLPLPTTADIAFFDDHVHPLITEIPHYYQVSKYTTWTAVEKLLAPLDALKEVDAETFAVCVAKAFELQDKESPCYENPGVDAEAIAVFLEGIRKFVNAAAV